MKKQFVRFLALSFLTAACFGQAASGAGKIRSIPGFRALRAVERFHIECHDDSPAVRLAVEALKRDFRTVTGHEPGEQPVEGGTALVIVNRETAPPELARSLKPLDGFESHRVYADPAGGKIYLCGADMRGTIYAIYTFSEQVLGVPPLWYWCSWEPKRMDSIAFPVELDLYYPSPQVRFRAWFPNSQDMLTGWRNKSPENRTACYETMLRLKLNTIEVYASFFPARKSQLTPDSERAAQHGLIISSTHTVALHSHLTRWNDYWKVIRKTDPPALTLANEDKLREFWRYSAETVHRSGIESLWTIAFRGDTDAPFWATFPDAPADDAARAAVINRMLAAQYDIIREVTGEESPNVKINFYDEVSDFLGNGTLHPPAGENVIWTYTATRRDHYPNVDIVHFDPANRVGLGYYMNLQFVSTGSHLAQGEGPWKTEFNFRYADGKSPLRFSVVNTGNIREELMTLSANAAMMWDMAGYDSDAFLRRFCTQYFGEPHAERAARLYRDFFHAYWQQRPSTFPGLERQYIFHDLRYSRAVRKIAQDFFAYTDNPLEDIGFERESGRTYNIESDNQVQAMLDALPGVAAAFERAARGCDALLAELPQPNRLFFNDNLRAQAWFMAHLNRCLYHFVYAYKHQHDKTVCLEHLDRAADAIRQGKAALYETQHGVFATWYEGDANKGHFNMDRMIRLIGEVREKRASR